MGTGNGAAPRYMGSAHRRCTREALQLMQALLSYLFSTNSELAARIDEQPVVSERLQLILTHIEQQLHQALGVPDLARMYGASREHFTRQFTETMGLSPVYYIQERRVARAMQLLRSDASIGLDDLAHQVGCGSRQHLTRLFRTYAGTTPGHWRRYT